MDEEVRPIGHRSALDHMRWLAAFAVLFSHARNIVMVDFPTLDAPGWWARGFYLLSGYGHVAVVVFFVLSGYLVGGKAWQLLHAAEFEPAWRRFVVDRFCRIAVVLVPALALSAACLGGYTLLVGRAPILTEAGWDAGWLPPLPHDLDLRLWLGNALLLNGLATDTVHSDGPLWSLAFEWSYYVIAAAAVALRRAPRAPATIAALVYASVLAGLSLAQGGELLIAGSAWLFGALAWRIASGGWLAPRWLRHASFGAALATLLAARSGAVPDVLCAAVLAAALTQAQRAAAAAPSIGARLAGGSFSLYAIHAPLLTLVVAAAQAQGWLLQRQVFDATSALVVLGLCAACIAAAAVFAAWTEQRTRFFRERLLRRSAHAIEVATR